MKESLCSEFNEIVVLGVTYQCKMSFTVHLIIWVTIVTAVTFKNLLEMDILHNFFFFFPAMMSVRGTTIATYRLKSVLFIQTYCLTNLLDTFFESFLFLWEKKKKNLEDTLCIF